MINLPKCCLDFDIDPIHLIFPERMSTEGVEFILAHGIDKVLLVDLQKDAIDMLNGLVKIYHRCDQLQNDGKCKIYESRPVICRMFDCSSRKDCKCEGKPWTSR